MANLFLNNPLISFQRSTTFNFIVKLTKYTMSPSLALLLILSQNDELYAKIMYLFT